VVYDGFAKVFRGATKHEVVKVTDSVAFLIHITDMDCVVLVSQQRGPMMRDDNPDGTIVEAPAGRFDVKLTVKGLIAKEATEEIGAKGVIPENLITLLNHGEPLALSPGILTERQYLAFVEITSHMIEEGDRIFGVDADEKIKRLMHPVQMLKGQEFEDMKTFALVQWFLNHLRSQGRSL